MEIHIVIEDLGFGNGYDEPNSIFLNKEKALDKAQKLNDENFGGHLPWEVLSFDIKDYDEWEHDLKKKYEGMKECLSEVYSQLSDFGVD